MGARRGRHAATEFREARQRRAWRQAGGGRRARLDCGASQVRGVALLIGEQALYVHIEETICDRCGIKNGPCAVPDFGVARDAYFEFVRKH